MSKLLDTIATWVFSKHQTFEEHYLSKSTDLADLERRQKDLRNGFRIKYWI